MTCAKAIVVALLEGQSGRWYVGSNACRSPQPVCPREPGEGYEKCRTICDQVGHAEIVAIDLAGEDARNGNMLVGYHYVCDLCSAKMKELNIAYKTTDDAAGRGRDCVQQRLCVGCLREVKG